ncbi:unnamed protein product [Caenorhabditis auriculariae]|uniref:EF-hand domain-containing protein n=1 Tax=Caenorhabditis auriculariae TaxID=2777116 RepID=A0A8S1GT61_9PELO|nr:unnamed protein product [Caenorhabditis auriculariae]
MILRCWAASILLLVVKAHQPNQFPGQNANQPPEIHHQNAAANQQQQHQQNVPPAQQHQQFGGEHARDEHHIKEHLDGKKNPGPQHQNNNQPPPLPSEVELETMIDSILRDDDFNADGFIDYGEFLKAQRIREGEARAQQQNQPPQH